MNLDKNMKIKAGVVIVVVAALFFYGGYAFAAKRTGARMMAGTFAANGQMGANGAAAGARTMRGGNAFANGGFTTGSIIAKDDNSITIKLMTGGSRIVFLGGSTTITKSVSGSVADLAVGANVMIAGTQNSDGSLTAQSVQIRPAGMEFGTSTRMQR